METLPITLFKDSFDPFVALLDEHEVAYRVRETRPGVILAGGEVVEIIGAVGDAAQNFPMWGALAAVLVAFIKRVRSRKVIITTKDNHIIHAEGCSVQELERILENAKNVIVFDPKKPESKSNIQSETRDEKA